jgi:hypothetical protein
VPSCFAWLHDGVSQHGWTTSTVYKYRNAVLTYLQLNERVRESVMSLKLRGRKRDVIELDTKRVRLCAAADCHASALAFGPSDLFK